MNRKSGGGVEFCELAFGHHNRAANMIQADENECASEDAVVNDNRA